MAPGSELKQERPGTLPADFGEWDGGEPPETLPADFDGFDAASCSAGTGGEMKNADSGVEIATAAGVALCGADQGSCGLQKMNAEEATKDDSPEEPFKLFAAIGSGRKWWWR